MDLLKEAKIALRLEKHEAAISFWRYEGEYAFYNVKEPFRAEHPDQPVDENKFVWLSSDGEVLGHVSYGPDGQIPTEEGYSYSDSYLDVGLGLRPELCGQGLGTEYVAKCLRFARERYGRSRFRLSVAAFNQRAVKVYQKAGFSIRQKVTNSFFHNKFYIMTVSVADS